MGLNRKRYAESMKREVAVEALKGEKTVARIAAEKGISPSMVSEWKNWLANGVDGRKLRKAEKENEVLRRQVDLMAKQLGLAQLEIELLKKRPIGHKDDECWRLVDKGLAKRGCRLRSNARSSV